MPGRANARAEPRTDGAIAGGAVLRARGLAAGLVVVAACASDTLLFVDVAGFASVVVVDEQVELVAESYATGADAAVVRPLDAATIAWVLAYDDPLDALALPAGRLTLGDAGGALPSPQRVWRVDGAGVSIEPLSPRLAALRVAERTGCRRFASRSFTFPRLGGEFPAALLPLTEDAALLTTTGGRFLRLGRQGPEVLSRPEGAPYLGGWSGRGASWLVGPGFATGSLEAGFERLEPSAPLDMSGRLLVDGPHDDSAPFELFALDKDLAVAHFDGLRWRRILEPPTSMPPRTGRGLVWIAPGRAAIVGPLSRAVLEVDTSGAVVTVPIDLTDGVLDDDVWQIDWMPGVGPVVGTRDNAVFARRPDGAWMQLPPSPVTPRADLFLTLADGSFLAGGMDGVFGQWTRLGTTCTTELVGVSDSGYRGLGLGTDLLFVSEGNDEAIQYTRMTPLPR